MALSSGFDNNLAMALLGVSMAGGLAYGGYVVFKNKPTAVTELLKSKKRVLLTRETEDEDAGKESGKLYLLTHTKKPTAPAKATAAKGAATPKPQEEFEDEDLGKLQNGKEDRANKDKVPESFKTKCLNGENEKLDGTGTKEYKNIEKYCSKAEVSEESET